MSASTTRKSTAKKQAEAPAPVEESEGNETKVGPLHEAHAAYIKRTTGKDVDPEAVFLIYSTRVAFRKTSEEYQEVGAKKAALKAEAAKAKEEAKAAKAKEREEAKAKRDAEKAEKAKEREEAKAKREAEKAEAKAKKEAEAAAKKAEADKAADSAKADGDKATSKGKKGKAAF